MSVPSIEAFSPLTADFSSGGVPPGISHTQTSVHHSPVGMQMMGGYAHGHTTGPSHLVQERVVHEEHMGAQSYVTGPPVAVSERVVHQEHGHSHTTGPPVRVAERVVHQEHVVHEAPPAAIQREIITHPPVHHDVVAPHQHVQRQVTEHVENVPVREMVPIQSHEVRRERSTMMVPETHHHTVERNVVEERAVPRTAVTTHRHHNERVIYERVPVLKRVPHTRHIEMSRVVVEKVPVTEWHEEHVMIPEEYDIVQHHDQVVDIHHQNPAHAHLHRHGSHAHAHLHGGGHHHHVGVAPHDHVRRATKMVPHVRKVPVTRYVEQQRVETKTVPETTYVESQHFAVRRRVDYDVHDHSHAEHFMERERRLKTISEQVPHQTLRAQTVERDVVVPTTKMVERLTTKQVRHQHVVDNVIEHGGGVMHHH
eukprot:TRINITY_DN47376_c0_g1_i1.p1 TRINITY_DN47376_c0_g1~~TRINITY_DN47376_c0_g1_i1.p1  ORF type:complete len:424 (+),score=52.60 TRINITY_DN47376_c0_g1_i1:169-1440(+)